MKTAEEILKNNVTHEFDVRNDNYEVGRIINAMKEYARLVAQQALENASENAKLCVDDNHVEVDKSSITNPDNIPTI